MFTFLCELTERNAQHMLTAAMHTQTQERWQSALVCIKMGPSVWILRNKFSDLETLFPSHKTEFDKSSFLLLFCLFLLPSTALLWNNWPQSMQLSTSVIETKKTNKHTNKTRFYIGSRQQQVIHSKLHRALAI